MDAVELSVLLEQRVQFTHEGRHGRTLVRPEARRTGHYWYALRKRGGKLHKVYLGKAADITPERLAFADCRLHELAQAHAASREAPQHQALGRGEGTRGATSQWSHGAGARDPLARYARLTPPTLPAHQVTRPRLVAQLSRPITLIVAPSGFGKTTLLGQWHRSSPVVVAWVSLETEIVDLHVFWTATAKALQQVSAGLGGAALALLSLPSPPPLDSVLLSLLEDLDGWAGPAPLALVIDDYHLLAAPGAAAATEYFLDRLPEFVRVVIASQVQPPFTLHRWRSRSVLAELNADDLRMTAEEGIAVLDAVLTVELSRREKLMLVLRVAGWCAGIHLLAAALRRQPDVHTYLANFDGNHPYLQQYIVAEILDMQPEKMQNFLLQTSILGRLTADLCRAVTELPDSDLLLHELCHSFLLVAQVDENSAAYQYHELFANALQQQLHLRCAARVPELHRRAARWCRQQGDFVAAAEHLMLARDWDEVADLIEQVIDVELRAGSDHAVLKWLQLLPRELFAQQPRLLSIYLWLAKPSLPQQSVDELLERLGLPIAGGLAAQPSGDPGGLPHLLYLLYQAHCLRQCGEAGAAESLLSQALSRGMAQGVRFVAAVAAGRLAMSMVEQGRLRQAEALAHETLAWLAAQGGALPPSASVLLTALSRAALAHNRLAEARRRIEEAVVVDPHPTSLNTVIHHHALLAHILHAEGNSHGGDAALGVALDLVSSQAGVFDRQNLQAHGIIFFLRRGEIAEAEKLLHQLSAYPLPAGQRNTDLFRVIWAEYFLAQAKYTAAEEVLGPGRRLDVDAIVLTQPAPAVLLALAYWGQRKVHQAQHEFARALRFAAEEQIMRPFLDAGPQVLPLLHHMLRTSTLARAVRYFAERLLAELCARYPAVPPPSPAEVNDHALLAQISPREQQVLRLLAQGLDNRALAAQLFVTNSTVRTHLRNLYRKLGVQSRTQALRQAHVLNLL